MALRGEVIYLVRFRLLDQADQIGCIRQIAVVKEKRRFVLMGILVEGVHPFGVEGRGAALDAMNIIAFSKQQAGEIGSVLTCDAGDEGRFFGHGL